MRDLLTFGKVPTVCFFWTSIVSCTCLTPPAFNFTQIFLYISRLSTDSETFLSPPLSSSLAPGGLAGHQPWSRTRNAVHTAPEKSSPPVPRRPMPSSSFFATLWLYHFPAHAFMSVLKIFVTKIFLSGQACSLIGLLLGSSFITMELVLASFPILNVECFDAPRPGLYAFINQEETFLSRF